MTFVAKTYSGLTNAKLSRPMVGFGLVLHWSSHPSKALWTKSAPEKSAQLKAEGTARHAQRCPVFSLWRRLLAGTTNSGTLRYLQISLRRATEVFSRHELKRHLLLVAFGSGPLPLNDQLSRIHNNLDDGY